MSKAIRANPVEPWIAERAMRFVSGLAKNATELWDRHAPSKESMSPESSSMLKNVAWAFICVLALWAMWSVISALYSLFRQRRDRDKKKSERRKKKST